MFSTISAWTPGLNGVACVVSRRAVSKGTSDSWVLRSEGPGLNYCGIIRTPKPTCQDDRPQKSESASGEADLAAERDLACLPS